MTYVAPAANRLVRLKKWLERKQLRMFKGVRNRVRHAPAPSRAMFIVGAGRSGTDLVASRLSDSFDVALFNEDHPAAFVNWRLRELRELDQLVQRVRAPVLLFKPIVETYRITELLAHFAHSRALLIARSPHDAINSRLRFFGEATRQEVEGWIKTDFATTRTWRLPPEVAAEAKALYGDGASPEDAAGLYWFIYNSAYRALALDRDPRVMVVLYEDLVLQPEREFRRACAHLGIAFRASMVDGVFSSSVGQHQQAALSRHVEAACQRVWRELMQARGHVATEPAAVRSAPAEAYSRSLAGYLDRAGAR